MYCTSCGSRIGADSNFCSECGSKLEYGYTGSIDNNVNTVVKSDSCGMKIASIVLGILGIIGTFFVFLSPVSLILTIVGLIFGIISMKTCNNVVGIVLNSIGLFLSVIIISFLAFLVIAFVTDNSDYEDYYGADAYEFELPFPDMGYDREYY